MTDLNNLSLVPLKNKPIFDSLQGEGKMVGTPATFLRLHGCDERCKWCDTRESWTGMPSLDIPIREIAANIERRGQEHLVLTGGEPMLQADALAVLLTGLSDKVANFVTLETTGSTFNKVLADYVTMPSLSPKLRNIRKQNFIPSGSIVDWLTYVNAFKKPCQVKIVISEEGDIDDAVRYFEMLLTAGLINKGDAIIQPEWDRWGTSAKPFIDRLIGSGFRFIPQMHKVMQLL